MKYKVWAEGYSVLHYEARNGVEAVAKYAETMVKDNPQFPSSPMWNGTVFVQKVGGHVVRHWHVRSSWNPTTLYLYVRVYKWDQYCPLCRYCGFNRRKTFGDAYCNIH